MVITLHSTTEEDTMVDELMIDWQAAVANEETLKGFEDWKKENDPALQDALDKTIADALTQVFGDDAMYKIENQQDPDAFPITVCLSAHQRLTCFVEVTVPASCDAETAERLASLLDDDMDAQHYEQDEEYWEGGTPYVEGFD
jgi:hypothetical protein